MVGKFDDGLRDLCGCDGSCLGYYMNRNELSFRYARPFRSGTPLYYSVRESLRDFCRPAQGPETLGENYDVAQNRRCQVIFVRVQVV